MKKSICDECGKKYDESDAYLTPVKGYCPKCIENFDTYDDEFETYDDELKTSTLKSRSLCRENLKELCEIFFKKVTHYNKTQTKQWRAQTLEERLTSEGRDMGSHIDNVNQILDTMERFLRCEPKE